MTRARRLVATFVLAVGLAGVPSAVHARAELQGAPDNTAVAINKHDGSEVFRFAFSIDRIMRETADPTNAAVAFSSCQNCRTVAIAIQFVLLMNDPNVVTPTNLALAANEQCLSCMTIALAYQILIPTDGPVVLSHDGQRQIHDIVKQIRALERDADLPPQELQAQVDALVQQLAAVVQREARPTGPKAERTDREVAQTPGPTGSEPRQTSSPPDTPEPTEPAPTSTTSAPSPAMSP